MNYTVKEVNNMVQVCKQLSEGQAGSMEEAISTVAASDVEGLIKAQAEYGDSWKKRGGSGAYLTIVRPLDRLDILAGKPASNGIPYDIFQHCLDAKDGDSGVLNAVRDLRRYLILVEAHLVSQGHELPKQRHNVKSKEG
jgi:hypothetical protein